MAPADERFNMALKPCRECKKKVSTEATTCPNCGVPNPTRFEKYYQIPDEDSFSAEKRVNAERKKAIDKYYGRKSSSGSDKYFEKKSSSVSDKKNHGFWNGTEGLATTFWLYFVVANMFLNFISLIAMESEELIIFVFIVWIGWNIFAVMGVFNAADNYKAEKIKKGETYGYATAAKVAVVLLILSGIGNAI